MNLINHIKKITYRTKRTLLIATVSCFVAACLIFSFILIPALRQFSLLSLQIKEKKRDMTKVQIPTDKYKLSELEDKINKVKAQLEIAKNKLFWEKDISHFLNALTLLASDLEIEFVSLKPEPVSLIKEKGAPEAPEYLFTQVPISVTLKSSYDSLFDFLSRIEETDKFIRIDTLMIESDRSNISKHNTKMMLSILNQEEG